MRFFILLLYYISLYIYMYNLLKTFFKPADKVKHGTGLAIRLNSLLQKKESFFFIIIFLAFYGWLLEDRQASNFTPLFPSFWSWQLWWKLWSSDLVQWDKTRRTSSNYHATCTSVEIKAGPYFILQEGRVVTSPCFHSSAFWLPNVFAWNNQDYASSSCKQGAGRLNLLGNIASKPNK